jgi:hypothetical protein
MLKTQCGASVRQTRATRKFVTRCGCGSVERRVSGGTGAYSNDTEPAIVIRCEEGFGGIWRRGGFAGGLGQVYAVRDGTRNNGQLQRRQRCAKCTNQGRLVVLNSCNAGIFSAPAHVDSDQPPSEPRSCSKRVKLMRSGKAIRNETTSSEVAVEEMPRRRSLVDRTGSGSLGN